MNQAILLLLLSLSAIAGSAPPRQTASTPLEELREVPDTPVGRRVRPLLDAIASGDAGIVRAFVTQEFSPAFLADPPLERHLAILAEIHHGSGGYDFFGVRDSREHEAKIVVRNRITGGWREIRLAVEPAPPHRIAGLGFGPGPRSAHAPPPPRLADAEKSAALEAHLERLARADLFSGAVLLAKDGKPVYRGAVGLASRSFGVPNRSDTKFNLGSMNKMFTAVAIAQLVEQGRLAFDDPLGKHLTGWIDPDVASRVTLHHLLTHTSGLGSYFHRRFFDSSRALFRQVEDYKPLVAEETLQFEPGTKWSYSNTGFLLLGAVLEAVTGRDYFEWIRERVTGPAGMADTDSYAMDDPVPNLAIGYTAEFTPAGIRWRNNLFQHVIRGGPAGGGFSTVDDLLRFDRALRSHRLLSPAMTRTVLSAKPDRNSPDYGYGFAIRSTSAGRVVGHSGGFPGISSNLDMYLDTGWTAVVLSNLDNGAFRVQEKIDELLQASDG